MTKVRLWMPVVCLLVAASATANTYTVMNTNDSGAGSLRQAILDANGHPGADAIDFNIAGVGVHTIAPLSALPPIIEPVTIDGYTQPGAAANTLANGDNAVILIELDGTNIPAAIGLQLNGVSGGSVIRGLSIGRFNQGIFNLAPNTFEGCFIGLDATGTAVRPNVFGIYDQGGTSLIGGATPAKRNLISGNTNGIELGDNSVVIGNYIGTNAAGSAPLGNQQIGVRMTDCTNATVGGTGGSVNVISGHTVAFKSAGIWLEGDSHDNTIAGNLIGTNPSSLAPVPNKYGIYLVDFAGGAPKNNVIGTNTAVNAISFNTFGVAIASTATAATGNAILFNTMQGNGTPIDLGDNGATANDPMDADAGQNDLQNFPVIATATFASGTTTVTGTLNSTPLTQLNLQLFRNASATCNARTLAATLTVNTDAAGDASFNTNFPGAVAEYISGTATNPGNSTSEVSPCRIVTSATPPTLSIDDVTDVEGDSGTLGFGFTVTLSAPYASDVTVDYATADVTTSGDYTPATGTLTIPAGQLTGSITVDVLGDTTPEPDETFVVNLSNPQNATIADGQGTGTIQNDDAVLSADVALTKSGPANAATSTNITYTLVASNAGPGSATNVILTDPLPAGTTFVTYTTTQGVCGAFLGTVSCNLGALASGANATVTLTVTTPSTAAPITNTATIAANEADPNANNNAAAATTTVSAPQTANVPTLDSRALLLLITLLGALAFATLHHKP